MTALDTRLQQREKLHMARIQQTKTVLDLPSGVVLTLLTQASRQPDPSLLLWATDDIKLNVAEALYQTCHPLSANRPCETLTPRML